jgi:tetratricopeptide (TPR) repeat protein
MINSLLTFGAKSVEPNILEQTLTVRAKVVNEIEKNCVNKTSNSTTWQSLIIAPRGTGKTHLIKVLYHRLKGNKNISNKSVIAYMSEDEVGIANFTDLMVSIIRAFVRYNESGSETLETQISQASIISDTNKRKIFVKDILLKFADKRIIILLIENFDKILNSLGTQGQGSLRDFIHLYNKLSIIATSQNLIAYLQDSKSSFYNFFNIFQLEKLDFNDSVKFLGAIAKTESNVELVNEIKKPELEGKLRAIYELTEGNHRLLVTFYSFLKADFKSELSEIFIKVMNDLKPYYEQFINALPPQQQKIVKHLSLNRGAISGKEIATACFIEPNVISKQLSLLFNKGMIDKNKSGKDVFYELKEPLMRICFEISENPEGISSLFVDFLNAYYDRRIIKEKFLMFKYGARFQDKEIKTKYEHEALMYSLVLSELEQEEISFAHKVFDRIDNYKELDSIIHSLNKGPLKQIDLSYESFKIGNVFVEKEQYEEAIKHYQKAVKFYPENDILFFQIGVAQGHLGKHEDALKNFQKAVELNPGNETAYYNIGVAFSELKQYNEAIEAFQKAKEIDPKKDKHFNHLGVAQGHLGKHEDALKNFQKAVELNPENNTAYYNMGVAFSKLEQYKESIDAYQKAVELNPEDDTAYYNMGVSFSKLKLYKNAIEAFQKAVEINPDNDKAFHRLGIAFSKLEQYKEAIDAYKKAVELNPENDDAYYNIGVAFSELKQYKEAIEAFQKAAEINPKKDEHFYQIGVVQGHFGKHEDALKNFQKAVELSPENDDAYYNIGVAFSKLKQYKEAIDAYQKTVELNPENDTAYLYMGIVFSELKQYKEAIEAFQKAAEINPDNDEAFYRLGIAFLELKQYKEAIEAFQKAAEINPDNDRAFQGLGIAVSELKQYKEAMEAFQKAAGINPDNDEAFYRLGIAFLELKQYQEAIEAFQKAAEINPDNDRAFHGLGITFSELKQYKNAIEAYQKAIELDPKKEKVYNSLGLSYLRIDEIDSAFEAFNKGLERNPEDMYTNFSLLGTYVRINNQNKSEELLIKLINKVDSDLLTISLAEDVLYNLFRFGSDAFIKSFFGFILKLLLKEKKDKQLWKSLPDSLFDILISIEDYEKERLKNIEKTLKQILAEYRESIIPLKMFKVGVAYLKNKEKNDVFKLSKEERKLFKEAVLDKRESISRDNKTLWL